MYYIRHTVITMRGDRVFSHSVTSLKKKLPNPQLTFLYHVLLSVGEQSKIVCKIKTFKVWTDDLSGSSRLISYIIPTQTQLTVMLKSDAGIQQPSLTPILTLKLISVLSTLHQKLL